MIGPRPSRAPAAKARARVLAPPLRVVFLLALLPGCSEVPAPPPPVPASGAGGPGAIDPLAGGSSQEQGAETDLMKEEILKNVLQLIETAATRPGGANIGIATENLNQYFKGANPADFRLPEPARAYLTEQLEGLPVEIAGFDSPGFEVKDARHIEDCLMYRDIASRISGGGPTLDRVRRLFNWTITQIALVPPGALVPEALGSQGVVPVPARPYDVLTRGLAVEQPGSTWSERSWIFLSLCRQIGVDAGLLAFDLPPQEGGEGEQREKHAVWCCVALVDGKPYLFDAARGLEILAPDGSVATLEQAAADPSILDRLDLPGQHPYPVHASDLGGKIRVLLDSSKQYFAPRMKLLQADLAGGNRMILHRDPAEQRDAFAKALGDRLLAVDLWELPLNVEYRLFNDPSFVRSTQFVLALFNPELPLLGARLLQLRGDLDLAKQAYVSFRFREALPMGNGEMVQLPDQVRLALDLHSTYFLAMCQLEQGNSGEAEFLLSKALDLSPRPSPGLLATLYGWGANASLGRLYDAIGRHELAIIHYGRENPTPEAVSNLLRARDLVWADPMAVAEAPAAKAGPEAASTP